MQAGEGYRGKMWVGVVGGGWGGVGWGGVGWGGVGWGGVMHCSFPQVWGGGGGGVYNAHPHRCSSVVLCWLLKKDIAPEAYSRSCAGPQG
jgi:hypothetical protein